MLIARYDSVWDRSPVSSEIEWSELVKLLTTHRRTDCAPCPGKDCKEKNGAAWSPVEFGPCPEVCRAHRVLADTKGGKFCASDTEHGSKCCGGGKPHRLNDNVKCLHAAVFDIDHVATLKELHGILGRVDAAGLAAVVHSSHSSKAGNYCVRLALRPSRPIARAEWARLRAHIERELELPADKSTKDEARLFFLPSAPNANEVIALSTDGADLPIDELLAEIGDAPAAVEKSKSAVLIELAQPTEGNAVDLGPLKTRMRSLYNRYKEAGKGELLNRAVLLKRVLEGEAVALPEGKDPVFDGRDDALNRLCSLLVTALPEDTPDAAILELIRVSVNLMPGDPPECGDWMLEAEDMIQRARGRRAVKDQERRDFNREVRERLMAESARSDDDAPLAPSRREPETDAQDNEEGESEPEEPEEAPPGYTDEQLARWAEEQGTDLDGFSRRWIIQRGKAFYIFVGGKYRAPITKDDLAVSLPRDLLRSPCEVMFEDDNGKQVIVTPAALLEQHATVARNVQASLALQRSFYDSRSETFFEAVCPLRRIRAEEHKEIQTWLTLLGGDQSSRLLDWVASVSRLDRQACALYLDGPKSVGKSLLATGLARLWHVGGASELIRVLQGFNDVLVTCPLVFADESLPQQKGITAELRRLIGSTNRNLNRKFLPMCSLDGALRLIIAGNNDRLLDTGEDLSANDLDAVAGRFLYVKAPQEAADFLASLGGPPVIGKWITTDMLAEHSLYLRETRTVDESARFLVEGITQEFHESLAVGSGLAGLVCEWLVRYLCDPSTLNPNDPQARNNLVIAGTGEVWVNADAMVSKAAWEKRVPSANVPSAQKIGRALRNLATGAEYLEVNGKRNKYHRIKPSLLIAWAERAAVVDVEVLRARINGPSDILTQALG